MAAVEERWPELIASARPAVLLFAGALAGCIGWGLWYRFAGHTPPIGIAIGVSVGGLILTNTRLWPLLVPPVLVSYWIFQTPIPLVEQVFRAVGLSLGAFLTAALIKRRGINPNDLLDPRSILWIFIAALAGSLVATSIVSLGGVVAGQPTSFIDKFAQQGIGMILAAPLVLVWTTPPRERWSPLRWVGFVAVILFSGAIAAHAFLTTTGSPMSWAIFPPLVLAALGWHLRGATTAVAISAVIVLWSTEIDTGPFSTAASEHRQLLAQIFVAITCATIFLLAAYADERHAEDKLNLAERRLEMARRNLTNMARDATSAVAILDRDLRFVATSKRFISDFRLPEDIPVERRSLSEVFPACAPKHREQYARVLAGETLAGNGDIVRHPDGTVDYVRWSIRPWRNEDDQISGVVITSEFVTAEMEARRTLEDAERRYRAVFEQAGVGVERLSLDGVYLEINNRICELTGYTRDELLGQKCHKVTAPEEWPKVTAAFAALRSGELATFSDKLILRAPDGVLRPVHCTATLVRADDGTPDHIASVLLDISEQVAAQRALENSEKMLRLAQEAAGVGMWEIDLVRGGSRQSPETSRMFGLEWRDAEIRMKDVAAQMGEAQVREFRNAIGRARDSQGALEMTLELNLPGGETRWVTLQGRYDAHDGHPRLIGLALDITRDMEADAQLREVHEKLLRLARLNAMGAMASTLAHELNQPLAAITNYLEACRYLTRSRGDPDHSILDALDRARVQALRAGDIIRKIRSFTVTGDITKAPLDLQAVIRSACTAVRQLKVAAGARIDCDCAPVPARLFGDTLQIEQVMSNLIRNGVEATAGRDNPEVLVTCRSEADEVRIQIADNGPGLSEAMLDNLFEPFRTTKESGTGLGLPICRTIVEAHGGRLWAGNGDNGGAVFSFTLPILPAETA